MKKIISILLITTLILTGISFAPAASYGATTSDWPYDGYDCTSNVSAASTINYILAKYANGTKYKGSGECYGWAEKISTMLAKKRSTKYYKGLKFTEANLLKKCGGLKAGTHLRVSNNKEFNGWSGHSIVLLKVTKKKVYWTEANVGGYNNIRHACATPQQFINHYNFKYLNAVTKTISYRTATKPSLTSERNSNGRCKLFWTKTTNTSKYKVYRATSKTGTYHLIKTTKSKSYVDTSAKLGKKYYYKVKSVKKSGSSQTSGKTYFTARLKTPVISEFSNDNKKGRIKISWKAVKGAGKYKIYRATDAYAKHKLVATTSKTSFTDTKVVNPEKYYTYKIQAVYTKNTKGNSSISEPYGYFRCRVAAPTLNYTYDENTKSLKLSWNKVSYADQFNIFYGTTKDEAAGMWYTSTDSRSETIDLTSYYDFIPGKTYYFWANSSPEDYWSLNSVRSNIIKFTIPADIADGTTSDGEATLY